MMTRDATVGVSRRAPSRPALGLLLALALLIGAAPARAAVWDTRGTAIDQIAPLLDLKPGSTVAEIGAGSGAVSVAAAEKVGPIGQVYATEIDPERIRQIRGAVAKAGLQNVTVVESSATDSHLPANCCDAIYMIGVYHHFTAPHEIDSSLFRALRPDGRLLVIDFRPTFWLWLWKPEGVPANRGGHGIPPNILEDELTAAGFKVDQVIDPWGSSWFLEKYCIVLRKPTGTAAGAR